MRKGVAIVTGVLAIAAAMFVGGALRPGAMVEQTSSTSTPVALPADASSGVGGLVSTILSNPQGSKRTTESRPANQAALAFGYLQRARSEAAPAFYTAAEKALASSFEAQARNNLGATLGTAILAGSRHDFKGQLRWGRRALEINPYNSEALGIVGDAYLELGSTSEALDAYQKMIDLRPDLSSFGRISHAAQLSGNTKVALAAMRRALGFAGTSNDLRAWAHWQLGELYIGAHRLDRAEQHLATALELAPHLGAARESTAHVAAARGRIKKAISIMSSLVEDFPLPGNYSFLGELYLLDAQKGAAQAAFDRADRRLDAYAEHGVRPDVDFITFWADRRIHLRRALRTARLLYSQRKSAAVSDSLAWALYAKGRFSEAQRHAREALRRSVGDAGYHYHAGMIARSLGQDAAARALLREALALDPSWSIWESHRARTILARSG
ncbi:MAG TPA: tetratricopeptide repeat protein [Actinomycetota bacterium]|nr:tetratricopeptide repeat protein [Actinomycetota bacterium]